MADNARLDIVAGQIEDIASGLSGNRQAELIRLSGLVRKAATGDNLASTPLTLEEQAQTGVQQDPQYSAAQESSPVTALVVQPITPVTDQPTPPADPPVPAPVPA